MKKRIKALWDSSPFARENLSMWETVSLFLEDMGLSRDSILLDRAIDEEKEKRLFTLLERAVSGEPLGYILGHIPFYKYDFYTAENVLIPRCDSEVLVERAVEMLPRGAHIIDFCTGTGCLGLSVILDRDDLTVTLVDISEDALTLASRNIEKYNLSGRASVMRFDVLRDDYKALPRADGIIMNPPYITGREMDSLPENVKREPALALFGGDDGLDFYRKLAGERDFLRGKTLFLEIGCAQGSAVLGLLGGGEIVPDLEGRDRVVIVKSDEACLI